MKRLSKNKCVYSMNAKHEAAMRAEPGDQILVETHSALHRDTDGNYNPATGPIFIEGAERGDILSVRIDKIEVESPGVVICGKDMGVLGAHLEKTAEREVAIEGDYAIFSEKVKLPLNKMLGVIGTAPKDEDIPCSTPDYHGGNMDCKEIREGATLLLPVSVPGALLALGDLHAVMGDGEIGISGVEVSGSVTITVNLIKGKDYPLPMIINETHIMTLASHVDLDIAVEMATLNMVKYLEGEGFDIYDATMLTSLVGDVKICQVVDPKKTIRVCFPKEGAEKWK